MLVRLSVCHSQPSVLWVSARPLFLESIEKLVTKAPFTSAQRFLRGKASAAQRGSTVDNIVDLIFNLRQTELHEATGMSKGYYKLVNQRTYMCTIENVKEVTLEDEHKRSTTISLPGDYGTVMERTMSDAIAGVIENNNVFKQMVFTGFSLGSGTMLASAYSIAARLQAKRLKIHCIQLAGTTVGNAEFAQRCKDMDILTTYIALENSANSGMDVYDPVTYMPYNQPERVHVADKYYVLDFNNHTVEPSSYSPKSFGVGFMPFVNLALGYLTKWNLGAGYTGFMKTHLAGEGMISRMLLLLVIKRDEYLKWVKKGPCAHVAASACSVKGCNKQNKEHA